MTDEPLTPLAAYYQALDGGDLEATLACFTDDAVYVRPSLAVELEIVRGRRPLRAFFEARGKRPYRHTVVASVSNGQGCFVEGVAGMPGEPPTHTFLVHATIAPDGRISRYFALMADAPPRWSSFA
jgi:ketosteroid isomerase-like protein